METNSDRKSVFRIVVEVCAGITVVLGVIFGFHAYVNNQIDKKVNSPEYLNKVASAVSPSIIFDDEKRILADLGGMKFIDKIDIKYNQKNILSSIVIKPKTYLSVAPLLTSLDKGDVEIISKRGENLLWEYEIKDYGLTTEASGVIRFRLEIIIPK